MREINSCCSTVRIFIRQQLQKFDSKVKTGGRSFSKFRVNSDISVIASRKSSSFIVCSRQSGTEFREADFFADKGKKSNSGWRCKRVRGVVGMEQRAWRIDRSHDFTIDTAAHNRSYIFCYYRKKLPALIKCDIESRKS